MELTAAYLGLKTFVQNESNCEILMIMWFIYDVFIIVIISNDNGTAISCMNRMGSIQYPTLIRVESNISSNLAVVWEA